MAATHTGTLTKTPLGLGLTLDPDNIVTCVKDGSQAEREGHFHVGDLVVALNGEVPAHGKGVTAIMESLPMGTQLEFSLQSAAAREATKSLEPAPQFAGAGQPAPMGVPTPQAAPQAAPMGQPVAPPAPAIAYPQTTYPQQPVAQPMAQAMAQPMAQAQPMYVQQPPAQATIRVMLPPGTVAGQTIQVQTPAGLVQTVVPAGMMGGNVIDIAYTPPPTAQPMAQAQPMYGQQPMAQPSPYGYPQAGGYAQAGGYPTMPGYPQ